MASLRDIKIEGKRTPEALDISQCLRADEWIDHDHPDIIKKAKELTDDIEDDWEKVIAIFKFILKHTCSILLSQINNNYL